MALFDLFRKKSVAPVVVDENNEYMRGIYELISRRFGRQNFEFDKQIEYIAKGYKVNPHVYTVVNYITRAISKVPFTISEVVDQKALRKATRYKNAKDFEASAYYAEKALEPTSIPDVQKLIIQPNETQTWESFLKEALGYYLVTGNRYLYGLRAEGFDLITKTYVMPSQLVTIDLSDNWMNPIEKYYLGIRGDRQKPIAKENVCHGKFWNPEFDEKNANVYGMSPLSALKYVVLRTNEAKQASLANFKNGMPPGILSNESGLGMTDEDIRKLESQWKKKYGGGKNAGKPLMTSQKFTWQNLGFNHVEMDLIAAELADKQDVAMVYGVPSELVGDKTSSTYNNVLEAQKDFWANTAIPMIEDFISDYSRFVFPEYNVRYGKTFVLDYDTKAIPALQQDKATLSDRLIKEMNNGMWTPNQVRMMLDKEPGEEAHLNKYYINQTLKSIESDDTKATQTLLDILNSMSPLVATKILEQLTEEEINQILRR